MLQVMYLLLLLLAYSHCNGLTHFTLSYSITFYSLSPGRSPSMQLGSYSDCHVDVAADRQFSIVPHPCGSSDGPWTKPALAQPMGSWERRRQGEHWCVTYCTVLYQYFELDQTHIHFINRFFINITVKKKVDSSIWGSRHFTFCPQGGNKMLKMFMKYHSCYTILCIQSQPSLLNL